MAANGRTIHLLSRKLRLIIHTRKLISNTRIFLTLSGPRFFRYRKDRGGRGGFQPPFDSSENWQVEYCICTYATKKISVLRVLGLKKASKFDLFQKCQKTKIFIFEYFSKIPSEMNSNDPFYPILIPNTPHVKKNTSYCLYGGMTS